MSSHNKEKQVGGQAINYKWLEKIDFGNRVANSGYVNHFYRVASKTHDIFKQEVFINQALTGNKTLGYYKAVDVLPQVGSELNEDWDATMTQDWGYDWDEPQELQDEIYAILCRLSEEDPIMKTYIAKIIWASEAHYDFTEEQLDFWKTDFELLEKLAAIGSVTDTDVLFHFGFNEKGKAQWKIQKLLTKLRQATGEYARRMWNIGKNIKTDSKGRLVKNKNFV